MNVSPREDVHDFGEHVLQECDRLRLRVEDVTEDAPSRGNLHRLARDAELGIRRNRGDGVARHLDLRDDGDVARLRIRDDLARVVLGVEAAVRRRVECPLGLVARLPADDRFLATRPDGGQPRRVDVPIEVPEGPIDVPEGPIDAPEPAGDDGEDKGERWRGS